MQSIKEIPTQISVHPLIAKRWSPRAFSDQTVPEEVLERILEAARWTPSSFNEQPWRLILTQKGEGTGHDELVACLSEKNQLWAKKAPILILLVVKTHFSQNGKANRTSHYDCGAMAAFLTMQATAEGLYLHQIGGLDLEKCREAFEIPEGYEPWVALAMGYKGTLKDLPEQFRNAELAPRFRNTVESWAYWEKWQG